MGGFGHFPFHPLPLGVVLKAHKGQLQILPENIMWLVPREFSQYFLRLLFTVN